MKIDFHYPDLGLWVTVWGGNPGRFDDLNWDRKQKLKEAIHLAVTDALRPADVPASAGDAAKEAGPVVRSDEDRRS